MRGIIAVVGGTGFLGRHVVPALQSVGYETRAFSRRSRFDLLSPDPGMLRGCAAVINLVGVKREQGSQTFSAVHVDAVHRLIEAMRSAGVQRLIHISVVVAREAPRLPYHHTKWQGEQVVRASGLDWTVLRPGVVYGAGDDMLSHLTLMIRCSPIFPIVNDGSAPMMPVDARDVARAVVGVLDSPVSLGRTYDVVGPDRLTLRQVVTTVAEAADLPIRICSTPVAFMRLPVRVMEATMAQPLSTRAQLSMLVEGLAGDPVPLREEIGVSTAPFLADRIRPIVAGIERRAPFDLRLSSAPALPRDIPACAAWGLWAFAAAALSLALVGMKDVWTGLVAGTVAAGSAALCLSSVRRRVHPTLIRIATGLCAGAAMYLTGLAALDLLHLRPWAPLRALYGWKGNHAMSFLLPSMVVTVVAEELLWRGVVARFAMERLGRVRGIVAGAALYALAHAASANPVLLSAALLCGTFWGWLYAATDDLVAPITSHLVFDLLALFVAPLASP